MDHCPKCGAEFTVSDRLRMKIMESLGSQYNSGVRRTVWRKQIHHHYCEKCKDEYQKEEYERICKFNEEEEAFFYWRFLPILMTLLILFFVVMIYLLC